MTGSTGGARWLAPLGASAILGPTALAEANAASCVDYWKVIEMAFVVFDVAMPPTVSRVHPWKFQV